MRIPAVSTQTSTLGNKAFRIAAASVWSTLALEECQVDELYAIVEHAFSLGMQTSH